MRLSHPLRWAFGYYGTSVAIQDEPLDGRLLRRSRDCCVMKKSVHVGAPFVPLILPMGGTPSGSSWREDELLPPSRLGRRSNC